MEIATQTVANSLKNNSRSTPKAESLSRVEVGSLVVPKRATQERKMTGFMIIGF